MTSRSTGWIQDPGTLENLIKVVKVFDHNTQIHNDLVIAIPDKVLQKDGRQYLIRQLNSRNGYKNYPKISYRGLVGTTFKPRASARCNGIIQALIPGQREPFISDWPANNFIRWAETLGFIECFAADDTYSITDFGLRLTRASNVTDQFNILKGAFLRYPPVTRILKLLYDEYNNNPQTPFLTKFELGAKLGFRGEDGFTTYPQQLVIQVVTIRPQDKNKILSDWEGSSDKYARMICGWLIHHKIGWVNQQTKTVSVTIGGQKFTNSIPQSYRITPQGVQALRMSRAQSRHRHVPKRVPFEMLAIKGPDRDYLRTRRAFGLQHLHTWRTLNQIVVHLDKQGLKNIPIATIEDEINNFRRIGLDVRQNSQGQFKIIDRIVGLTIPSLAVPQLLPSHITRMKLNMSTYIKHVDHSYFDLLDLGFDGKQNKLYELRIVDLLNLLQNFMAQHLPGPNRPEIIAYYRGTNLQTGVITDCKVYSTGFSLPNSERDKMVRYLNEYQQKNPLLNTNKWWEKLKSPGYPHDIRYCFVSSNFIGQYSAQMNYINLQTGITGGAITSKVLIEKVDNILNPVNSYSVASLLSGLSNNTLVL